MPARWGSPPRVRGTGIIAILFFEILRITPACAGNSFSQIQHALVIPDHPRVCGEQIRTPTATPRTPGSPPRVRGTACPEHKHCHSGGITPACAGNRRTHRPNAGRKTDHPRVCGEQSSIAAIKAISRGSPPRVRGTVLLNHIALDPHGITPACAGNRVWRIRKGVVVEDHPRVCGEQKMNIHIGGMQIGSPPRVRGTVQLLPLFPIRSRITPACAGNSGNCPLATIIREDHPRVCGEQIFGGVVERITSGSPPRVRGTGNNSQVSKLLPWITPACAGNRKSSHPGECL